jgi:hypothetical protein
MAGFPTRTTRAAFGPTKRNLTTGLITPEYYTGATETNLNYWQTAGMTLAICRCWALVTWDGATSVSVTAAGEAWDPTAASAPTVARSAQGVYTVTYDATYVDETDTAVSTALYGALICPMIASSRHATFTITSSRIINVYMWDAAGAAADASFLVAAF